MTSRKRNLIDDAVHVAGNDQVVDDEVQVKTLVGEVALRRKPRGDFLSLVKLVVIEPVGAPFVCLSVVDGRLVIVMDEDRPRHAPIRGIGFAPALLAATDVVGPVGFDPLSSRKLAEIGRKPFLPISITPFENGATTVQMIGGCGLW